jgi:hypothetical protein
MKCSEPGRRALRVKLVWQLKCRDFCDLVQNPKGRVCPDLNSLQIQQLLRHMCNPRSLHKFLQVRIYLTILNSLLQAWNLPKYSRFWYNYTYTFSLLLQVNTSQANCRAEFLGTIHIFIKVMHRGRMQYILHECSYFDLLDIFTERR